MLDNDSMDAEESTEAESLEDETSIGNIIDSFLHRVLDIEDCAQDFISIATKKYNENSKRLKSSVSECQNILENEQDKAKVLIGERGIRQAIRDIERHNNSSHVATLEKSLFIYLFAAFDKYIGDLIHVLYQLNPDLYKNIKREISLSDILKYSSIEEVKQEMLGKEIETLLRKGYAEQFKDLTSKFSITLTKFDDWPYFIECSQRRNLFTHCDGIVSKQYIEACKEVGVKFKDEPRVGEQLHIGSDYFFQSCHIMIEVAVMLGHTLWRKTQPKDLESADAHLSQLAFNFLHMEDWGKAIAISQFALGLPKISRDEIERIFTVNYAIALKSINKDSAAKNVLDKKDWSATTYDFKLAYAVLTDNYSKARFFMEKMGKEGELIDELAYHDWPLFKTFRDREEFFEGYSSVYGYEYSFKLNSIAEEKKNDVEILESNEPL